MDVDPGVSSSMLEPILRERLETFKEFGSELSRYAKKRTSKKTLENLFKRADRFVREKQL